MVSIAFLDIEISPTYGTFWGNKYETNILEITQPWVILSFSWKWETGEHITKALPDYKDYTPNNLDDLLLVADLHRLMSEADIIVAQNGNAFDIKKINARFVIHNMRPPVPYKTVDTLKIARSRFGFTSNKLDDLGEALGLGRKMCHEGYTLWKKCMAGEPKAWRTMKRYNKQDVVLLEKIYHRLLPFGPHPNLGMWNKGTVCPKCGSSHLNSRGTARNATTEYRQIQCQDCGGWSRTTFNERETKPLVGL